MKVRFDVSGLRTSRIRRRELDTVRMNALNSDVRASNWRSTLRAVAEREQVSRADLARITGCTRATMSSLVADLIDNELVVELGVGPSSGGKPPRMLALNAGGREVVALDLSRQPFQAVSTDLRGTILRRAEAPEAGLVGDAALQAAGLLVEALLADSSAETAGIGIGCPGMVTADGSIVEAAALEWHDVPLAARVAAQTGLPVWVANDADAAALSERSSAGSSSSGMPGTGRLGAADNLAVVKIGAGVGLGLVLGGHLYHGAHAAAGEIGHIVVTSDGARCICGSRGCLETVASVAAIREAVAAGSSLTDAVDAAARHLAWVLGSLVAILDLPEIVIALEWREIEDQLVGAVRHYLDDQLTPAIERSVTVRPSKQASILVLRGATALVLWEELGLVLR